MSTLSGLAVTTPTIPSSSQRPRRPGPLRHGRGLIHAVLHTHLVHRLLDRRICELSIASAQTGRHTAVQVRYVRSGDRLFVLASAANGHSRWWRAFTTAYPVRVLLDRRWHQGLGRAAVYPHPGWRDAERAYGERFPELSIVAADVFIVIALRPAQWPTR